LFLHATPPPPAFYTLSLHDALPIFGGLLRTNCKLVGALPGGDLAADPELRGDRTLRREADRSGKMGRYQDAVERQLLDLRHRQQDRKSTRLNSSHVAISYAVFCLKK